MSATPDHRPPPDRRRHHEAASRRPAHPDADRLRLPDRETRSTRPACRSCSSAIRVGRVILGYENEIPVSMADMLHHIGGRHARHASRARRGATCRSSPTRPREALSRTPADSLPRPAPRPSRSKAACAARGRSSRSSGPGIPVMGHIGLDAAGDQRRSARSASRARPATRRGRCSPTRSRCRRPARSRSSSSSCPDQLAGGDHGAPAHPDDRHRRRPALQRPGPGDHGPPRPGLLAPEARPRLREPARDRSWPPPVATPTTSTAGTFPGAGRDRPHGRRRCWPTSSAARRWTVRRRSAGRGYPARPRPLGSAGRRSRGASQPSALGQRKQSTVWSLTMPDRLHERVADRRADEAEAAPLQIRDSSPATRRSRRGSSPSPRHRFRIGRAAGERPEMRRERGAGAPARASAARALSIVASILARLRTMPVSASRRSTSSRPEAPRRDRRPSPRMRRDTRRACGGSCSRRGPACAPSRREHLEDMPLVARRHAPLLVVVAEHQRVGVAGPWRTRASARTFWPDAPGRVR